MLQIIQMAYMTAMMIGAAAFGIQVMTSVKNLCVDNNMVKSKSTTVFLGLILLFNFLDFMTVIFYGQLENGSIERMFILENLLSVAIAYSLVCMERDYAGEKRRNWVSVFFLVIAMLILWADMTYTSDRINVNVYLHLVLIVSLNAALLTVVSYFCFRSMKSILAKAENKKVAMYLTLCTVFLAVLCIIVTLSIVGSRTAFNPFRKDKEIYVIFWIALNAMNMVLVWTSCKTNKTGENRAETVEERIDRLASERGLSSREREIAFLLYKGKTNNEIADMLFLSSNTIKVHTSNLYRKLGISTRMQAVGVVRGEDDDD